MYRNKVKWHIGRTFSIDTIINIGLNSIEIERAADFRASKIMNIPLIVIINVSDNIIINNSLISGRTEEEILYRRNVGKKVFPKYIYEHSQN